MYICKIELFNRNFTLSLQVANILSQIETFVKCFFAIIGKCWKYFKIIANYPFFFLEIRNIDKKKIFIYNLEIILREKNL